MGHPNGKRPPNPQQISPHTARVRHRQEAARYAAHKRRQRAMGKTKRLPWKTFFMCLPLLMAAYVLLQLWTD